MHALTKQVADLTAALQANSPASTVKSSMNKLDPFEGQSSAEARRFLAQFISWAAEQPDLKNHEQKTIKAALGFLTKKAANWATAYLTDFNEGRVPFNGLWTEFVDAFKLRFKLIDPGTEARDHIKNLSQLPGQNGAEYAQNFKDIGGRTGLSDMDLLDRFNDGLLPEIKKNIVLVNSAQDIAKTLDEAIRRAVSIDTYLRDPTLRNRANH